MWYRLKNFILSFTTYRTLSPDLHARRRVNRALRDRPALTAEQWFETFCQPLSISKSVATFAYKRLEHYSGLKFAYIQPGDRLEEDLQWTQVCWFDWETTLCEDVWQTFQADISDYLYGYDGLTIKEFLIFLEQQITENKASH